MEKPLDSKLILVTRPRGQAQELCEQFHALGAETLCQPAIEIRATPKTKLLDDALRRLVENQYDLVIFNSANGVAFALDRLMVISSFSQADEVGALFARLNFRVAAIGPGTARALANFGIEPTIMPSRYDSDGLVDALRAEYADLSSVRALAFRANRGRATLGNALRAADSQYEEVEAYQNVDVQTAEEETLRALESGAVAAAVAMSSASANALVNMLGDAVHRVRWVAISALTAQAFEARGVEVAAIAREATTDALVDAVVELLT